MRNPTESTPDRPRPIGIDPLTGKRQYAVTEPGSALDAMADGHAIKAAAALVTVTGTILENGDDASELVPDLYSALSEMVEVAARHCAPPPVLESAVRLIERALLESRGQ
ncbi:hypothetical protein OG911_25285 [Streptomyces sp. NBC_00208]|uniref:hypothetical protein n=1 Tax=Streptomyces sp. NBC_00208 TaxID=2975681 RepID=UPI002E27EE2A|nr:hypothetical protein [Streptomyces sp. NBC_00208]